MPTPETPRHIYALVPVQEELAASDYAPMEQARLLADRCNGHAAALLIGNTPEPAIQRAEALGMDAVWVCATAPGARPLEPRQLAAAYAALLRAPDAPPHDGSSVFFAAAGRAGEEIAARLAALLAGKAMGRCESWDIDATGILHAHRMAFGGRLQIDMECREGPFLAVVHSAGSTVPAVRDRSPIAMHQCRAPESLPPAYPTAYTDRNETHASLDGARLVVSGGRGIGDAQGFEALYGLAERLGGAVGASLPAIDAGWAPVARQVGQSGKYVSPEIYLAVGISGTPQHLAGIAPHVRLIAINRDDEAEIFKHAQIGIVADWKEFLPALARALDA
ncbi:electron transfer flavoprotein subunit alpha/FixB family protein [Candidimonas humi]|jgi:electron transfer flavoprotein alpha subunit|uniref:Electron transfer flavoprotein subunit alpha/FixB family protein n=1 Tax=Candidimonas humi TaxID=683355 RepID=A0ABV8NX25_9BURK|nr:electron transfer flavoprotein subunit alpha/FixB family protein [Candidimonas humi]MBV6304785.1 electron transfer flavoprotein subunit alpha/FixB family protein [Candidimonas humi]